MKRNWILNLFLLLTVVACALAFLAHSRNWIRQDGSQLGILSGFYYTELDYDSIARVEWELSVPQLLRKHGYAGGPVEKGIFIDSLHPDKPVRVYIDDWERPKIYILTKDSSRIFLNLQDSLETEELYHFLQQKLENGTIPAQ